MAHRYAHAICKPETSSGLGKENRNLFVFRLSFSTLSNFREIHPCSPPVKVEFAGLESVANGGDLPLEATGELPLSAEGGSTLPTGWTGWRR